MESEKIINPLDHKDEHDPRFETKKWYIINHVNNRRYGQRDKRDSTVKIDTDVVKPFLVDYTHA